MASSTAFAGSWDTLPTPLTPWVYDVIQAMGHIKMTPVQASTIPLFMKHKDVVVEAVTGSGKTLAFVIPILERLIRRETMLRKHEIGALIISPTRELATQIHSVFQLFLNSQPNPGGDIIETEGSGDDEETSPEYPDPLLLVSSSSSSPADDIQRFLKTGANIVIGTPGRVEEFLLGNGRANVNAKELEVLVLDEADRLLDLGFSAALTRILTHLPKQRRTGLFSATMTDADALSELVRVGLRNPARIVVKVQSKKIRGSVAAGTRGELIEERRIPANLSIFYVPCLSSEKTVQLVRILLEEMTQQKSSQFIVYFATGACVDYFYRILPGLLPAATFYSLHGHLPPAARTRTLTGFSTAIPTPEAPAILLATDVAARGLDLPHVDVVIQFDPPSDPKAFSHRCGRTARAGRSGRAWVLLVGRETEYVDFLNVRKIPMKARKYLQEPGSPAPMVVDDEEYVRPADPAVNEAMEKTRKTLLTDRALHDMAAKAFVSFVRAYSKHEASYIFRLKDLDLVGVAKSFGVLRLPKMPEMRDLDRSGWKDEDVNWDEFAYSDKAQEAKRMAAGAAAATARDNTREERKAERAQKKQENAAWSQKVGRREEKDKRREKKGMKRKWLKTQAAADEAASAAANGGDDDDDDGAEAGEDWKELAKEDRMAKKAKRGGVSQATIDDTFADL